MSAAELYDMVMLSSTYELLDRMPEVPRKPILITAPLPPPPKATAVIKPVVPKIRVTKPAATAAVKEALRAAKAAEKAAVKEATRLRRELAAAVAKHASKPAKKV
jgi:hypothetical protein